MKKFRKTGFHSTVRLAAGTFIFILAGISFDYARLSAANLPAEENKIIVFVSILPQAYFVERVGGERVEVHVLVGPGHSPATYEPVPKQMTALNKADLYFRIGVPFEGVWLDRIRSAGPKMKIVDTRTGIPLMAMKTGHHHGHDHDPHDHRGLKNPHIWLSLRLVKTQAATICDALASLDRAHEAYYRGRLQAFHRDLDRLDGEIIDRLKEIKTRKFMVFHPAWSYFAADYGLEEIPIEIEGKEPGPKDLARVIQKAKTLGIRIVFVQAQFSRGNADTVARAIDGEVVTVDPLARDYLDNMKRVTETFAREMQ